MTKLHDIFLSENPDFDHSQAIRELIEKENLDINAKDNDGNTILHLMATYIYKNYHNPFFIKDNPKGKFNRRTGYIGAYNDYKGPDFFDDFEVLLALGANPNLRNNRNESVIQLLFNHAYSFLYIPSINTYFDLIQKYYPHALCLIDIFQITNYFTNPKFFDKRYKEGFNVNYGNPWIESDLLDVLDERLLPLDCLESLVKWIDQGNLKELDTSDKVIDQLRQRLVKQINYQQTFPSIIDATKTVVQFYHDHKDILLRGMLINDPGCPIYGLLEQLNNLTREEILTKDLNESLDIIFSDYNNKREICEEIKLTPVSLDKDESLMLERISENLGNALNGKIYQEAYQAFNQKTDYAKKFMLLRWGLFQEFIKPSQAVKNELEQRFQRKSLD